MSLKIEKCANLVREIGPIFGLGENSHCSLPQGSKVRDCYGLSNRCPIKDFFKSFNGLCSDQIAFPGSEKLKPTNYAELFHNNGSELTEEQWHGFDYIPFTGTA